MADKKVSKKTKPKEKTADSTLYYFYSVGLGWCKITEPIVDELNKEGYNILKLDLADKDNQEVQKEVKEKFKLNCGTPFLVDPESGNNICGFREKDIIQKWADGEEIPKPPTPTGPPPKPPLQGSPKEEEKVWKEAYNKWLKENDHLPDNMKKTADEILAMPRPKTEPPAPPNPRSTDAQIDEWGAIYDKWKNENSHLPNLQETAQLIERVKRARDAQAGNIPQGGLTPAEAGGAPPSNVGHGQAPNAVPPSKGYGNA